MCIDKLFCFIPSILDFYNLNFLHYNFHFLVFVIHLKYVAKTKYIRKKEASKLLLRVGKVPLASIDALHLSHYSAAICALFCRSVPLWKDWQKEKYLPCATCFLKHIISKMAISSWGGFVPLNKTLADACRAAYSDFTAQSCARGWAADHKIKCHNTFSEQGVWHHCWSTARYLRLHLHFQAGWHLWLPVFPYKKSNYDLPEHRALSFSCLATITALLRRAWV